MHSKTLAVLFLSATAVTALDLDSMNDSSDDYYSSLMSGLNSLAGKTDYEDYFTDMPTKASAAATATGKDSSDKLSITSAPSMPSFDLPPASIESVLATAVPASFLSQMANPSAASSVYKEIKDGHYPSWYKELPSSVKDWLSTHYVDATATATGAAATDDSGSSSGGGRKGKGGDSDAAPPSAMAATGLMGAACILAMAVML